MNPDMVCLALMIAALLGFTVGVVLTLAALRAALSRLAMGEH
jgi:hypothetical protein